MKLRENLKKEFVENGRLCKKEIRHMGLRLLNVITDKHA